MKLSDLDNTLSEAGFLKQAGRAIGQAAASTGLLGKNRFAVASTKSEKKRQEKEKAETEKTANYTFQKLFYSELESGLESAVQNGLVKIVDAAPTAPTTPTTPQQPADVTTPPKQPATPAVKRPPVNQRTRLRSNVKESYADFDVVLESKILNESSISDYITQFVAKETRKLAASPEHTASVKTIADRIQADITNQVKAGKIATGANFDISGNAAFKSGVKQLADLITAWPKRTSGSQSQSIDQSIDVNNNNVPDSTEREEYKKNLLTMLANIDFNDKNSSQVLLGLVNSLMGFIKSSQK